MESCATTLSEALGHLFAEGDYRLGLLLQELEVIRIFGMGLWAHIAGYSAALLFLTLAIYVWVRTGTRKEGGAL